MKQILIWMLFFIALAVFLVLAIRHTAPWPLIALYWLTLTAKNGIDCGEDKG